MLGPAGGRQRRKERQLLAAIVAADLAAPCRCGDLASGKEARQREFGKGSEMAFDAMQQLADAGNPVDLLTGEQREIVSQLSEHEVEVLNSVKARLDAVGGGEVEGQDVNIFRFG
jgi:hypothetical protein